MTLTGSSPRKFQRQGTDQPHARFVATVENAPARRSKLVKEIAGMCKPRQVKKMINLLPEAISNAPFLDCTGVPHGEGKERFMYVPMAQAVLPCIPGMEFVDTSGKIDTIAHVMPDAVLMPQGHFETKVRTLKDPNRPGKVTYNYMAHADLVWEFKPSASQDPFDAKVDKAIANQEGLKSVESDTQKAIETRGQITEYATQVMSLQHRTHVFIICIVGERARIIRWDRSGCMASEAFDYKSKENNYLGEFLWRYTHASRSERGFDDTAVEATETEIQLFTTATSRFLKSFGDDGSDEYRKKLAASIGNVEHVAYKLTVKDKSTKAISHYVVRQPFAQVLSPCGRATRGYLAYHVERKKAVFFKDTWRAVTEGIFEEAEIYGTLIEAGVPHLPIVLASGDVYSLDGTLQETLTHIMNSAEDLIWATIPLRHHIHHRVAQELALPISFVRDSRQLVQIFRNVLETIMKAFETRGFLHRDISSGNVMLTQEFEGILNDWDHGVQVPQQHMTRPYRTGTWAFMSIELLRKVPKQHALVDDVESCFWLILFVASRYFDGGVHPGSVLWDEIDRTNDYNGQRITIGGNRKFTFLFMREYEMVAWQNNTPLTRLIHTFAARIRKYHRLVEDRRESAEDEEKYQLIQNSVAYVAEIIKMFDDALDSDGWPTSDAVPDKQIAQKELLHEQEEIAAERAAFSKPTHTTHTENVLLRAVEPTGNAAAAIGPVAGSSMGIKDGQSWAAPPSRLRDPLPEYSTGDKRPGPADEEAFPGTSGQTQSKRVKKDEAVALDSQVPIQPTVPVQPSVVLPPSESPGNSRPIAPRPRRAVRSKSRNNDRQAPEAAPAAPLRRSTRSRSHNAARSEDSSNTNPPRRVTRSTTRKASEEDLRRTRSQTRARAKSTNGRF